MRFGLLPTVAAAAVLWGGAARADSSGGSFNWSGISADTAPSGQNVVTGGIGFPGFTADVQHGMGPNWDIGGKLDLDYAWAFAPETVGLGAFQANFLVPMRFRVFHQGMMNLQVHVDPGLFVASSRFFRGAQFGLAIEPGVILSFDVLPNLKVGPAIDLPMAVDFLNGGEFTITPLFGGSVEWMVIHNLSLGLNMRFGFTSGVGGAGALGTGFGTGFAMELLPTVAYRW